MPSLVKPDARGGHVPDGAPGDHAVSSVMTPGVLTIVDDAPLRHVLRAMSAHGVHAILAISRGDGRPLGWVTDTGLLPFLGQDDSMVVARAAVSEPIVLIAPGAPCSEAIEALRRPEVSHLLVSAGKGEAPEGVVSALDLIAHAAR